MGKGLLLNIFRCRIEGQYFLITCIAGLAEGVNLVTKTVLNSLKLSHEDTIGRIPMGVLWIFFKKYSLAGRTFLGGDQKATMSLSSSPFL